MFTLSSSFGKTFLRITNNNSLFFILKSKIIILKHNNILIKPFLCFLFFFFLHLCCYCYLPLMGLVFWNSIHLEVPSDSFCFLINSSWLLVFILFMICWKGIYFSYNLLHIGLIFSFHYWCSSCPSRVNWKLMKKEESRVYGKVEDQEWLTIDCQGTNLPAAWSSLWAGIFLLLTAH